MKYVMNGGLIIGSKDGANLEIEKEIGSSNMFLFGSDKLRFYAYQKFVINPRYNPFIAFLKVALEWMSH